MRLEIRSAKNEDGVLYCRGVVGIVESEEESLLLDEVFGDNVVGEDGFISTREVECRLSGGYREHYIYIKAATSAPTKGGDV